MRVIYGFVEFLPTSELCGLGSLNIGESRGQFHTMHSLQLTRFPMITGRTRVSNQYTYPEIFQSNAKLLGPPSHCSYSPPWAVLPSLCKIGMRKKDWSLSRTLLYLPPGLLLTYSRSSLNRRSFPPLHNICYINILGRHPAIHCPNRAHKLQLINK
ncbi:predicted protein [Botrytis cinerea T4]|uniref:Uncharacterized protein n=1 Tax=Botryotinia fuckeliana (strain T4) TaxID=999810 RepID=G2YFX8_BOTF4|nr:predicted protein [Botrytis cinerea T4]